MESWGGELLGNFPAIYHVAIVRQCAEPLRDNALERRN